MNFTVHPAQWAGWSTHTEEIRSRLGGADNPLLLPDHFLQVVLPKLGGAAVTVAREGVLEGYGFLLPRALDGDLRVYTLRYHSLSAAPAVHLAKVVQPVEALLPGSRVVLYDPRAAHTYEPTHQIIEGIDFGRPTAEEAEQIPALQQIIWNNPPEVLYPSDIHSREWGLATSLVARCDGELAGFLFGFYKFGGSPLPHGWADRLNARLRIESQTMGVLPSFRGRRIGQRLKILQARQAQEEGIDVINWTADPLQFPNAVLNFTRLRAVAYEFHPALYPFHNQLNQVVASRFSLTWLVGTERVRAVLEGQDCSSVVDVGAFPDIAVVNRGWEEMNFDADVSRIAVEIPPHWTALQRTDLDEARRWRDATDRLLAHYVGAGPGQYIITAAGVDGPRRYLIGTRADEGLWARLVR